MKINKNIPLKDYTSNVRKIIMTPVDVNYTSMICTMPDKDIKTAIKLMEEYNTCKNKQEFCRAEIRMRELPGKDYTDCEWGRWFSEEWNYWRLKVRRLAGYRTA